MSGIQGSTLVIPKNLYKPTIKIFQKPNYYVAFLMLTLDRSISKPGTLPETRPVSPPKAGTTPKLVKAANFSLPSYKSSSPCSVFVEAPTPRLYNMTCVGP